MTLTTGPASGPALAGRADLVAGLIDRFARLTEPDTGAGVTRLAYTPLERTAHRVFGDHMRRLGLRVWTDPAGNTLAELPGQAALPALGTGSHLDSVPGGGAYDGVAGVVAAMAAATELSIGPALRHPVRFVAFAAEEGARFGQACTGSRLAAGLSTPAKLESMTDRDGVSIADAMRAVDIDPHRTPDAAWDRMDWAAFVELHIEQGAVLTSTGVQIGIVDTISGSTRVAIDLTGRTSHTGGTPMHLRADALTAAAQIVLAAEALACDSRHHGTRITVGKIDVKPGSITTIPGRCRLLIDIRDTDDLRQRNTAAELIGTAEQLAAARGIGFTVELLADASPVLLPVGVQAGLARAADTVDATYRVLSSGASHDTQMIGHVCSAGMIFVPSQNDGISHAPEELTLTSDLARGVDVLVASLRALDTTVRANGTRP